MANSYFIKRHECPICQGSVFNKLYSCDYCEPPLSTYLQSYYSSMGSGVEFKYLKGAAYTLNECKNCGLVFQEEIPNDELMIVLYEKWIDPKMAFDRHERTDDLRSYSYYAQEIMQFIGYLKKAPCDLKFFDFGMGWGKWARMAKAFGCASYGAELSSSRIEYAKANGIEIVQWDEIPDQQFDFINTEQVFEHLPHPLKTLLHLKKALKNDGLLKINVPNGNDIKRRLKIMDWAASRYDRNSLVAACPLEHINCFNRSALLKMVDLAGLKPVYLPLLLQYAYNTNWTLLNPAIRNILRPIYRSLMRKGTFLLLGHK